VIKRVKRIASAALAVLALCGAAAATPVGDHGQLSVKNGKIVDKNDEPVQLRGMSFGWSNPSWESGPYYTAGAVGWLASDWKVDIVRAAMDPDNRGGWETVVEAAVSNGIYVIIDWHSHNAHKNTSAAQTFFSTVSNKYKNTPNVLYEIYNEPCASGANGNSACQGDSWANDIRPYAQAVVNTIRNNDTKNVIVIGTGDFSKRVDMAAANPVSGSNLAYSVHYYTAEPGTQHQATLRGWCTTALSNGLALFVTEFGLSEADGGQKNTSKLDTDEANIWFDFLDANQIGWVNWSVNHKNEAASALKGNPSKTGNWSSGDLSPSGTFIRNKLLLYANTSYTMTLSKSGEGTVAKKPDNPTYKMGTPVTVTATPASGWAFVGYEGGATPPLNTANPAVVAMNANKSMKAVFEESNLIKNGTFTVNIASWTSSSATNLVLSQDNYQLKAGVVSAGASAGALNVSQGNIKLEKGRKYALTFSARGQSARSVTPRITNPNGTRDYINDYKPVTLTATMQQYTVNFEVTNPSISDAILQFDCGGESAVWYLDDVKLKDVGAGTGVASYSAAASKTAWSISKSTGALQIRGPLEAGVRVSLYDTRGKALRNAAANGGVALSTAGIPAGSYFVVVRNRAGADLYRARVSL
jgi:endoglucanase